jgi:hypothetical protein
MKKIIALAEHRQGELRDITWEILSKGRQLAEGMGAEIEVALLGKGVKKLAEALKPKANRVLLIEDDRLEAFNSETYQKVLTQLIIERKPFSSAGCSTKDAYCDRLHRDRCSGRDLCAHPSALWRKSQCSGFLLEERAIHDYPAVRWFFPGGKGTFPG